MVLFLSSVSTVREYGEERGKDTERSAGCVGSEKSLMNTVPSETNIASV